MTDPDDEVSEDFRRYIEHIKKSAPGLWFVARWLWYKGYDTLIPIIKYAPDFWHLLDFVDGGDILATYYERQFRFEVKHLSINFTSRIDWPYGTNFIVCSKGSFDHADPVPYKYFIVSNNFRCIAEVHVGNTRPAWTVETRTDSRYINGKQDFYFCPTNLVTFTPVKIEQAWVPVYEES